MKVKRNIDVHAKAITMLVFVGLLCGHTSAALLGTYGRTNPTTNVVPNNFELLGAPGSGGVDTDGRYSSGRTVIPCNRKSSQLPVSSKDPRPTWPHVNVLSVAVMTGSCMSSQ